MVNLNEHGWRGARNEYYATPEEARQSFARAFGWKPASDEKLAEVRALPSRRPLKVFLCHAHEDKPQVRDLHAWLITAGCEPWLDELELIPGEQWRNVIPKRIRESDVFVACLSRLSTTKTGYVQKEFRLALEFLDEMPPGRIFLIPVRIEPCDLPGHLEHLHTCSLFDKNGHQMLSRALNAAASKIDPDDLKISRTKTSSGAA